MQPLALHDERVPRHTVHLCYPICENTPPALQILACKVGGFDFSPLDRFLFSEKPIAVHLADLKAPWRPLTRPEKVLEVPFQEPTPGAGRQSMTRLDVISDGILNAVVSWFELHMDDSESVSSMPDSLLASLVPAPGDTAPEMMGGWAGGGAFVAPSDAAGSYEPAATFAGHRAGMVFKMGSLGLGYYKDTVPDSGIAVPESGCQEGRNGDADEATEDAVGDHKGCSEGSVLYDATGATKCEQGDAQCQTDCGASQEVGDTAREGEENACTTRRDESTNGKSREKGEKIWEAQKSVESMPMAIVVAGVTCATRGQ